MSEVGVNRKAQDWCFTDYVNIDQEYYERWWEEDTLEYLVVQIEECPETKNLHAQGFCVFKTRKALSTLKKLDRERHWEARKGTRTEASVYCKKDESRAGWRCEWGKFTESEQGKRSDLLAVKRKLDEGATEAKIADEHFSDWIRYHKAFREYKRLKANKRDFKTEVIVYWGPAGTGKSHRANVEAPGAYRKDPATHWFDGYDGYSDVIIDEFLGLIPWDLLLRMMDKYPLTVQVKGGYVAFAPRRIIITSNKSPQEWYDPNKYHMPALERRIDRMEFMNEVYQEDV